MISFHLLCKPIFILEQFNGGLFFFKTTVAEDALLQEFFPCNNGDGNEDSGDPYSSDEFRMYEFESGCRRRDACEFAYGVFECWLHPASYRTQVCKDGKNCKRKVCFFAHTPHQLRVLPLHNQIQNHNSSSPPSSASVSVSVTSNNHYYVLCSNSSISLK
ncbi:hypothetical protein NE237_005599 [Protea cynaroides]|uniref:Uncharacterized protein n=1 Tax=Protea cynaroides TaxID=273540 RepID=A0A9Q0GP67_9MAGN|nr:hypothetical protein NE237_005599 [Protea cynaroides]